jgi:hypothetical protein
MVKPRSGRERGTGAIFVLCLSPTYEIRNICSINATDVELHYTGLGRENRTKVGRQRFLKSTYAYLLKRAVKVVALA